MRLENGQRFPSISVPTLAGEEIKIPDDLAGKWAVLLFYRGHWWPYCRQQLADFQNRIGVLGNAGVRVVAMSVDSQADARKIKDMIGISYTVGYGLDALEIERLTGAYINRDPPFVQATGFILQPDGTIAVAVYSSDQVGRLLGSDAAGFIEFSQAREEG